MDGRLYSVHPLHSYSFEISGAPMDWLYIALMIAFILISVALVHGFERIRPAPAARDLKARTGSAT